MPNRKVRNMRSRSRKSKRIRKIRSSKRLSKTRRRRRLSRKMRGGMMAKVVAEAQAQANEVAEHKRLYESPDTDAETKEASRKFLQEHFKKTRPHDPNPYTITGLNL